MPGRTRWGAEERTRWFPYTQALEGPRLRLFCLPYLGGSAMVFRGWQRELPEGVEVWPVQLPGRERRLVEPPFTRISSLVAALARDMAPCLDRPYALFGYSLGGLIAFELARRLRAQGAPSPSLLLISAARAPHLRLPWSSQYHRLPDDGLIARLRELGGTPPEVLEHTELMELILPAVRADFELLETYSFEEDEPLDTPISAFGAVDDPEVSPEALEGWRRHTRGVWHLRYFQGGHFFLVRERQAFLAEIGRRLGLYLGAATERPLGDS